MMAVTMLKEDYESFNTASGMDCMQFKQIGDKLSPFIPFQYRKRYGLHAIWRNYLFVQILTKECFNTASGMDCMQ